MDTTPLEQQKHLIEQKVKQAEALAAVSRGYRQWLADCQALADHCRHLLDALAEGHRELETLLDRCDQLADQLDHFDSQGHSIATLEPAYQDLVACITQLQDRLDEHT